MLAKIWAIIATAVAAALAILHFANPYPLMQIPEKGHRHLQTTSEYHDAVVEILRLSGARPWRTFRLYGVRQTLFDDGITVVSSGDGVRPGGAASFTAKDTLRAALRAKTFLLGRGIESEIWAPGETLAVVRLSVGGEIAYTLPGREMKKAPVQWE